MLERPRMKLVKLNYDDMISPPSMLQDFYDEFLKKTLTAIVETENKIIREFAEEEGLSLNCAEYLIRKHFRFRVETISPKSMVGTPRFNMVLEPKPVEEILNDDVDTRDILTECEKEIKKNDGELKKALTRIANMELD